jgi:hypothetical protein
MFVLGDVDRVRKTIESLLLDEEFQKLKKFSDTITKELAELVNNFENSMQAKVLMAGGDDILLFINKNNYNKKQHLEIIENFTKKQIVQYHLE